MASNDTLKFRGYNEQVPSADDVLHSWKEIAVYLKRGVRTVQRWEQTEGLPIHRHEHQERSSVYASRSEIDQWWQSRRKQLASEPEAAPDSSADGNGSASAPAPRGRYRWIGVSLAVMTLMASGLLLSRRTGDDALVETYFTRDEHTEVYANFAPDGETVAYAWNQQQDHFDIFVRRIGEPEPRRLTSDPAPEFNPSWSPDGRKIAFLRMSGKESAWVMVYTLDSRSESKLAEVDFVAVLGNSWIPGGYLTWMPDGTGLIVSDRASPDQPNRLCFLPAQGGTLRPLTSPPASTPGDAGPAFSPDGRWLAFHRFHATGAGSILVSRIGENGAADEPRTLPMEATFNAYPAWSPDGKDVIFTAYLGGDMKLMRAPLAGGPSRRLTGVGHQAGFAAVSPRTRRLMYTTSRPNDDIMRVNLDAPDGRVVSKEPVIEFSGQDAAPAWSPDGQSFALTSTRTGWPEAWVCDATGKNCRQVSQFGGSWIAPRWSPDGKWLATFSNAGGNGEIYVIPASGGPPRRLTTHPADDLMASFSRDGAWIYFASNRTGAYQIWRIPAEGGSPTQITREGGYDAVESRSGGTLYYTKRARDFNSLWKVPAGGGPETELIPEPGPREMSFDVTTDAIYFLTAQRTLERFGLADGTRQTIWKNDSSFFYGFSISPDRRSFLISEVKPGVRDLVLVENFH